ncbi:unnamed protein product [Orchesella dallaii]|uniref:Uncharacterized protein n=1 Tax=Orchesella dallaii TaxID=48710 RepID=A0ABP1RV58_9HEXA
MANLKEILQLHHQFIFQYLLRLITIFIQLGCGIWATTLTAFYNEKEVSFWAYIIFGIYFTFTLCILASIFLLTYFVYIEMQSRSTPMEKYPLSLNNIYAYTCLVTICFFTLLLVYNSDVLLSESTVNLPFAIMAPTILGFRLFWPQTPFFVIPCAIFVPWIDVGCGFVVTSWATFYNGSKTASGMWIGYGIFGAQCIFAGCLVFYYFIGMMSAWKSEISITKLSMHPIVLVSATGTTICFWVVAFYDVVILGHESVAEVGQFFWAYLLFFFEQNVALFICTLMPKTPDEINEENENGDVAAPVLV